MRHSSRSGLGLLVLASALACAGSEPTSTGPVAMSAEQRPTKNTDTAPRGIWAYHATVGTVAAAMRGDGQDRNGAPLASGTVTGEYQNDVCGVAGKIFEGGSGDATIQPQGSYSSSLPCGPRIIEVSVGGTVGTQRALAMNVQNVIGLANEATADNPNPTRLQEFGLTLENYPACERLRFGHTVNGAQVGDRILVTYLGRDASDRRRWRAESTGSHGAGCFFWKKGGYQWDGVARTVPFLLEITEVPYSG